MSISVLQYVVETWCTVNILPSWENGQPRPKAQQITQTNVVQEAEPRMRVSGSLQWTARMSSPFPNHSKESGLVIGKHVID